MRNDAARSTRVQCRECPLAALDHFRAFNGHELAFVSTLKTGELVADRGTTIFREGAQSPHLYTMLSGWGFRAKAMDDGRRQILNFIMPGDLIGLQGALLQEMQHSVEALSDVVLCVFERERLSDLYKRFPSLAYDITWMAAREERILDENLLSLGRRSALERAAYLLVFLYQRARAVGLTDGTRLAIPITQYHVADTLGLSIVHTNRTLRKLTASRMICWLDSGFQVIDEDGLLEISGWEGRTDHVRPFL